MAGNQGLGSDNMSDQVKRDIQSKGGKASRASSGTNSKSSQGDVITNREGGGRLTTEDQRKGGRSSRSN